MSRPFAYSACIVDEFASGARKAGYTYSYCDKSCYRYCGYFGGIHTCYCAQHGCKCHEEPRSNSPLIPDPQGVGEGSCRTRGLGIKTPLWQLQVRPLSKTVEMECRLLKMELGHFSTGQRQGIEDLSRFSAPGMLQVTTSMCTHGDQVLGLLLPVPLLQVLWYLGSARFTRGGEVNKEPLCKTENLSPCCPP